MRFLPSLRESEYTLVGDDESKHEEKTKRLSHSWKTPSVLLIGVVIALCAGFGGYLAGVHNFRPSENDWLGEIALVFIQIHRVTCIDVTYDTVPAGSIKHTFHYRKIFTQPPTNETEKVWEVMFPSMSYISSLFGEE